MARYLLNVVETYRVPTVNEALEMRDEMNAAAEYELQSFQYTTKFNKKTEEEYQIVKVKKVINTEKDPVSGVQVKYEY
jgi:hypothetical protein